MTQSDIDIRLPILTVFVLFITSGLAAASGAPGGLFYPMLTLGGAIGLIMGNWVEIATNHAPSTATTCLHCGTRSPPGSPAPSLPPSREPRPP